MADGGAPPPLGDLVPYAGGGRDNDDEGGIPIEDLSVDQIFHDFLCLLRTVLALFKEVDERVHASARREFEQAQAAVAAAAAAGAAVDDQGQQSEGDSVGEKEVDEGDGEDDEADFFRSVEKETEELLAKCERQVVLMSEKNAAERRARKAAAADADADVSGGGGGGGDDDDDDQVDGAGAVDDDRRSAGKLMGSMMKMLGTAKRHADWAARTDLARTRVHSARDAIPDGRDHILRDRESHVYKGKAQVMWKTHHYARKTLRVLDAQVEKHGDLVRPGSLTKAARGG